MSCDNDSSVVPTFGCKIRVAIKTQETLGACLCICGEVVLCSQRKLAGAGRKTIKKGR